MICETNEEYLQGLLLSTIVDDCIFEECIDVSLSFVVMLVPVQLSSMTTYGIDDVASENKWNIFGRNIRRRTVG